LLVQRDTDSAEDVLVVGRGSEHQRLLKMKKRRIEGLPFNSTDDTLLRNVGGF